MANPQDNGKLPLVTCIMPTYNRREFIPHAIRYFLRQDYPNKELLIVDDSDFSSEDIIPEDPEIRYLFVKRDKSLGDKRNFCIRESRGEYIMHWDDDDWMSPDRISYQMGEMLKSGAEICGITRMFFRELETGDCWLYEYPEDAQPWLAGGSLLYTRDFWSKSPFPDKQVASDTAFIFSRKIEKYKALDRYDFYVASIHKTNTSAKETSTQLWRKINRQIVKDLTGDDWYDYIMNIQPALEMPARQEILNGNKHVSACLLSYKRVENLELIVQSLEEHTFIDEIIIWNNNPDIQLKMEGKNVRIINSTSNRICYGRFLCAREAKNEFIYVQDDDALVRNIPELYHNFLENNDGIVHALQPNHYRIRHQYDHFYGQAALLGWGAFFKKSYLSCLDRYLMVNKEDYLFQREADQIFTITSGFKHHTLHANISLLNDHQTEGIALYRETQHAIHKGVAANRALAFNRNSRNHDYPVTWNVVIPCSNYSDYLGDAINSVLQNMADYVITIVDDGSTDNTPQLAKKIAAQYPFISYIRLNQSKGVGYARNRGIAAVQSIFVVLLDADDKIGHSYLSDAEKLLRSGCDVANPDAILFGNINSRWEVPEFVSLDMMLQKNRVHTCAAFRRSYWAQVGGIDETLTYWQDYDFWIRLAEAGARIRRLPGDHFFYRKHGNSKTNKSDGIRQILREKIQQKHQHLYLKNSGS